MHGAIWGAASLDGRPLRTEIAAQLRTHLAAFGKGGIATFEAPGILLGRAEATCNLEPHDLVLRDRARGTLMVNTARLDDRSDLCARLAAPSSIRDDQLLHRAWCAWSEDCGRHVPGDWSCAVYREDDRSLVLARDPIGTRPIFYAESDGALIFASTVAAVRATLAGRPEIDPASLPCALGLAPWPARQTIFQGVRRLPPGSLLRVRRGQVEEGLYWDWRNLVPERSPQRTDAEWTEAALALLERVVADRAAPGSRIGVPLSGGLDSSAVLALAARGAEHRVAAVSAVLPDSAAPGRDERQFQTAVLTRFPGVEHRFVTGEASRIFGPELEAGFELSGSPLNAFHPMDRLLGETLRGLGAKVMLSGYGGDFAISFPGYDALAELVSRKEWHSAFRLLRTFARSSDTSLALQILSAGRRLATPGAGLALGKRTRMVGMLMRGHRTMEEVAQARAILGLETSYPLLDRRLMAFCLSLPADQQWVGGMRRSLLRRAMQGILPDLVTLRRDKGSYFPFFPHMFTQEAPALADQISRWTRSGLFSPVELHILKPEALARSLRHLPQPDAWTRNWMEGNLARSAILVKFLAWCHRAET